MPWAIKWRSDNRLDGKREYFIGRYGISCPEPAPPLQGHTIMAFKTRQQARAHITKWWGYIRSRPDLQKEPHGWKTPVPVKVTVEVKETEDDSQQ